MGEHHDERNNLNCRRAQAFRDTQRHMAELLLIRSEQMTGEKKALLRLILDKGASYEQLARLSGEHATTVSRRFHAMVRRLGGKQLQPARRTTIKLTPLEKTILIESFINGAGQQQIAEKLGISRYRVRKALSRIKTRTH